MTDWTRLDALIREHGQVALVTLVTARGSTPRDAGASMIVTPAGDIAGSIGGGALEWQAIEQARALIAAGEAGAITTRHALGPDLGQCCGGFVELETGVYSTYDLPDIAGRKAGEDARLTPLLLFGAGHVGRALVMALAPLPFAIDWTDPRESAFPPLAPANTTMIRTDDPAAQITAAPAGAFVLIMTHDHALDFTLVAAALKRPDFPFIGLIGSATKRARFEKRLRLLGLDTARLVCPIGLPEIVGKEPAIIAAGVTAQLLALRSAQRAGAGTKAKATPF